MKRYIKTTITVCLAFMAAHCAQSKPSVDIKVNPSVQLQDGSPLSLPNYDELSPQLVQTSDGKVALFFVSNRPADGYTCTNSYTVFIATTTVAYTGGTLPPFNSPQVVYDGNTNCLSSSATPFKIAAYAVSSNYQLIIDNGTAIISYVITGTAWDQNTPTTFAGSTHRLLGVDAYSLYHEIFTLNDGGQIYYTKISESPTTSIAFQGMMGIPVESIAPVPSDVETNGFFFLDQDIGMGVKDSAMALPHLSLSL
ncbi:MAG TPA: hypothetical protein PLY93_11825, partial [Turneriella sp.]|nr:hypothetical protein [Turneriella sp.]